MSRIINLRIQNFRCLKNFTANFNNRFIVLLGRGDSGKSTILKAIEALLSPSWNYSFTDWDFSDGDITKPIIIEGDITEIPAALFNIDDIGISYKLLRNKTGEIDSDIQTP